MTADAGGDLAGATNTLVLAPSVDEAGVDACANLLVEAAESVDRLAVVAVGQTPDQWHRRLTDRLDGELPPISYIDVKTLVRSTSTETARDGDVPAPVATVSSPADLVTLGKAINSLLGDAAEDGDRVGLCLYSITEMLQFVDREFLFKFLHAVTARVRSLDGVGLYHLDNEAPDEELQIMFAHLCDTVATFDGEGVSVSAGYYAPASGETES